MRNAVPKKKAEMFNGLISSILIRMIAKHTAQTRLSKLAAISITAFLIVVLFNYKIP